MLNPKLTLFGNAPSKHLAYDAWNSRELPVITNNQAGSIIIDFEIKFEGTKGHVYVTNESFAREANDATFESSVHKKSWYWGPVRS